VRRIVPPIAALAIDYPTGHRVVPHQHGRAQLVFASSGVMRVSAKTGIWVVPPQRAVWIPARVEHAIELRSAVSMRTLYFSGNVVPHLPKSCAVVNVSPLLRELVLRAMSFEPKRRLNERQKRLAAVLLDEIHELPVAPLYLPSPRDERLTRLMDRLAADPGNVSTLEDWGREVGASARTLARLFAAETGMSFRRWREQLRLIVAIERLAAGEPVTSLAMDLGYESTSAFISMFRRNLGTSPGRYFSASERIG
jgi:AraC-like DNA-binding protein